MGEKHRLLYCYGVCVLWYVFALLDIHWGYGNGHVIIIIIIIINIIIIIILLLIWLEYI